ncbi:MAG TPA: dTDP-4-dehydrorhamnose 3,5-epimerase [Acidobacteriaceae bacterium]|nr:dTDP-4-dehydrorhamnose 3,5-epimerase [Acidobacteriaceae bacterium]
MEVIETHLPGVVRLRPRRFADERGWFMETWNEKSFQSLGLPTAFRQDNQSRSHKNVLRGLHYQIQQPQGKLIRAVQGRIFDVAVDIRRSSPAFGKWVGVELDAETSEMLWIPPGFAHGFLVLSDSAEVLYKATDFYCPPGERTLLWNDPAIDIAWPIEGVPIVSGKDAQGAVLSAAELPE